MRELVFPEPLFKYMHDELWKQRDIESAAVLLLNRDNHGTKTRFLVREVSLVPPELYERRTSNKVEIDSRFVAEMANRARKKSLSLCFVHTHVASLAARFSSVDDIGEGRLKAFLDRRMAGIEHLSLVLSQNDVRGRLLGTTDEVVVTRVGTSLYKTFRNDAAEYPVSSTSYDRQIRVFGELGQRILETLTIGVVGVGGTGSSVIQSLAYLGVNHFILVDPDLVSETNLNRLIGATKQDVGKAKVAVAEANILTVQSGALIQTASDDVANPSVGKMLRDADFIFCCTDTHGSRHVINQLTFQYLIPTIDMGVGIASAGGEVRRITGRVQMLSPGLGCLACANMLDPDAVRRDLQTAQVRNMDPYFIGEGEPAPAVISINTTMASLAVTMFLSAVLGIPGQARLQVYDGIRGTVRVATAEPIGGCVVCSTAGYLALGDSASLPEKVE